MAARHDSSTEGVRPAESISLFLLNPLSLRLPRTRSPKVGGVPRLVFPATLSQLFQPIEPESPATTPAEAREERLANNEILFRSVNESIQELAVSLGGADNYEFICECSARGCVDRVKLTRAQYEHVRAEGTRFFVVPGHENVAVEEVVETQPTYLVVEKDGHAGIVADMADPRDGDP